MIPTITFIANGATVILIVFGGHLVMTQAMTLGQLSAFMNYVMLFIFPIISLGFLSNFAMQAGASYTRIQGILQAPAPLPTGGLRQRPKGTIEVRDLCLERGGRRILHAMSFVIPAGSRVAIVGPTAAGKTQLMQILCGLTAPTSGEALFDGHPLSSYDPAFLAQHVGVVFQDSVIFQASFAENIGFQSDVHEGAMRKALETAELTQFVDSLPEGLDTMISERGSSLSGGQKQRLMLARALVQDPSILLLDDFTARVDGPTQQRIVQHLAKNYPKATCINITQNIASITTYDQILLVMEGELLGIGTHESLLTSCVEYAQMYTSQHSTNHYELYTDN